MKKYFIIFLFSLTGVSAQEIVCDDCSGYFEKEKTQLTFFKDKNIKEKQKLTGLRKAIFKHIPEVFLTGENMFVSIYVHPFINDNITVQCSSGSTLNHDKILFLDQLFWSEKIFEYVAKKLKKNIIPTIGSVSSRQTITKDFINRLKPEGYYQFMLKLPEFKDHNNRMAVYYPKNQQKLKPDIFSTKTIVNFARYEADNEVVVEFHKTRHRHLYTNRYMDNQWKLVNTEKQRY